MASTKTTASSLAALKKLSEKYPRKSKLTVPIIANFGDSPHVALDWDDFVFRDKNGALRLYFARTKDAEVTERLPLLEYENVAAGTGAMVTAAMDAQSKLAFIEFTEADKSLSCHLFDYTGSVDGIGPMALRCKYSLDDDVLMVYFVEETRYKQVHIEAGGKVPICSRPALHERYNYQIIFDVDLSGRIMGVEILSASLLLRTQSYRRGDIEETKIKGS